jgi:hypothetical protein
LPQGFFLTKICMHILSPRHDKTEDTDIQRAEYISIKTWTIEWNQIWCQKDRFCSLLNMFIQKTDPKNIQGQRLPFSGTWCCVIWWKFTYFMDIYFAYRHCRFLPNNGESHTNHLTLSYVGLVGYPYKQYLIISCIVDKQKWSNPFYLLCINKSPHWTTEEPVWSVQINEKKTCHSCTCKYHNLFKLKHNLHLRS